MALPFYLATITEDLISQTYKGKELRAIRNKNRKHSWLEPPTLPSALSGCGQRCLGKGRGDWLMWQSVLECSVSTRKIQEPRGKPRERTEAWPGPRQLLPLRWVVGKTGDSRLTRLGPSAQSLRPQARAGTPPSLPTISASHTWPGRTWRSPGLPEAPHSQASPLRPPGQAGRDIGGEACVSSACIQPSL